MKSRIDSEKRFRKEIEIPITLMLVEIRKIYESNECSLKFSVNVNKRIVEYLQNRMN